MSFATLPHSLWFRSGTTSRSRRARLQKTGPRGSFRPRLEALEERVHLSNVPIVVTSLADSGSGTLRFVIATIATADGDTSNGYIIDFDVTGGINLASALPALANNITIQGPGAGSLAVRRDNSALFGIFTIDFRRAVSISDLTIANGDNDFGGGILNNGTVKVTDCNLTDNTGGDNGGGIESSGTLVVTGCNFDSNATQASGGAGIDNVDGPATVTNCNFTNNSGSGIFIIGGTVVVMGCNLDGNAGEEGGGISNFAGTATVTNCILTNNSSSDDGGGIFNDFAGTATVTSCTLTNNSAGFDGGSSSVASRDGDGHELHPHQQFRRRWRRHIQRRNGDGHELRTYQQFRALRRRDRQRGRNGNGHQLHFHQQFRRL